MLHITARNAPISPHVTHFNSKIWGEISTRIGEMKEAAVPNRNPMNQMKAITPSLFNFAPIMFHPLPVQFHSLVNFAKSSSQIEEFLDHI